MASIHSFDAESCYEKRIDALKAAGIALWDVLHACARRGSLDIAIEVGSRVPNDFGSFLAQHHCIKVIAFNGTEAEASFNTYVLPHLQVDGMKFVRLPSSSPAHARSLEHKIAVWREALGT
jgi:hypoxanthine-DNA glycosylase